MLNIFHLINPLYSASGFAVGALVGFTGVGGGSLMTPLLVLLFGIHPATAVGTDLLYAGLTKICGSAVHGFNDSIDWRVTRRLASGSVPAAALTLVDAVAFRRRLQGNQRGDHDDARLRPDSDRDHACVSPAAPEAAVSDSRPANVARSPHLTTVLGVALGVLVSLSSVGAGAIGVTVLLMLYPRCRPSGLSAPTSPMPFR